MLRRRLPGQSRRIHPTYLLTEAMGVVVEDVAEGVLGKISVDVAEVVHGVLDEEIQEVLGNLEWYVQLILMDLRLRPKEMVCEIFLAAGAAEILTTSNMTTERTNGVLLRNVWCVTSTLAMSFMMPILV